jgi:predicted esterase
MKQLITSTFTVPLECQYFLRVPDPLPPSPFVVITLHGYGMEPQSMLRMTSALVGPEVVVAAIRGPNQQFLDLPPNHADDKIGYNWGTPRHFDEAISMHHAILSKVIEEVRARFAVPAGRIALMGFSQPVSLNYRFAATFPNQVGGIIALCGGVPGDWETSVYQSFTTPVLHIARSEDASYPVEIANKFPERLRKYASDVEFHMIPGQHRFPSKGGSIVEPWIQRVFGR